ncbi:phosphatidyl synthase [Seiridium cupressi]
MMPSVLHGAARAAFPLGSDTRVALPSLNLNPARVASRTKSTLVTLKPAPLSLQPCISRSLHLKSAAATTASAHAPQPQDAMACQSSWTAARRIGARVGTATGIVNSPRPCLTPVAAASRNAGYSLGNGIERRTLSRYLSFKASCRAREGKSGNEQPTASPSGLRKVLPKSIGAVLTPHENIYTVPNLLTFSRLIAAPFIGYAILHDAHVWALSLFVYAGVSDLLDGWIARRWNLQTVVGSVVDPMADKALMTILTVCLAAQGSLPVWLAVIILGRDVGLAISAIYYRWISLPPPKTFTRYWDFSLPSAEVRPTTISKYNTFLQLALMGSTVVAPLVTGIEIGPALVGLQPCYFKRGAPTVAASPITIGHWLIKALMARYWYSWFSKSNGQICRALTKCPKIIFRSSHANKRDRYIVATTTIWSGLSYVFSKDAVKILSNAKNKEISADTEESKKP